MDRPADRVRAVAGAIPPGDVMTYGQIGQITELHPRQVGRIVSQIAEEIPWWRIVRADGTPATCHGGSASAILVSEHVPFVGSRVDWRRLASAVPAGFESPAG